MKAELLAEHAARSAQAAAQMRALAAVPAAASTTAPLRLTKRTSNLFRDRAAPRRRLDLSAFGHVLAIDREAMQFDAEGLVSYEDLVAATLPQGCMPAVVPQLKTITVGGAVAGVGIEATSFRHGLVHDTLTEIEVLLPDGQIVTASASNAHRDLFFGFPNSYGTLGYALRVRARLLPVKPYVQVRHLRHSNPAAFIADLTAHCAGDADFVDGVVFGPREQVVSVARFVDAPPPGLPVSDYTFEHIYYRSLRSRDQDLLSAAGYLWRWDTDWFWCSKNVGAQHPLLRRLYGRRRLGSRTRRVPRLPARRSGRAADLGLPDRAGAAPRRLHAVSAAGRHAHAELRLLGRRAHARAAAARLPEPQDRSPGDRGRRHQVALLGQLLRPRHLCARLQPRGLRAPEAPLRPGGPAAGPVRQVRAARVVPPPGAARRRRERPAAA